MQWTPKPKLPKMNAWRPWFAWHPVKTTSGTWVWLERIERLLNGQYYAHGQCYNDWIYSLT